MIDPNTVGVPPPPAWIDSILQDDACGSDAEASDEVAVASEDASTDVELEQEPERVPEWLTGLYPDDVAVDCDAEMEDADADRWVKV